MKPVAVVGSINMDIIVGVERAPKEGETLLGTDSVFLPGGKGANQAVACARMGARTTMLGRVGIDPFGDTLLKSLSGYGVDASNVIKDKAKPSGIAMISVFDNGNNTILVSPGANGNVSIADVEHWEPILAEAGMAVFQLEIPLETIQKALAICRKHNIPTILDAGPAMQLPDWAITEPTILSPNETETTAITGIKINSIDDAKLAADELLKRGARQVVIKLGAKGSLIADKNRMTHVPAFTVNAVDPTACGDAFTGVMAVKLSEGVSLDEAVRYASAAGALTATRKGAQQAIPTKDEVERFIEKQ